MTSHVDRVYAAFQIDFQCGQVWRWRTIETLVLCVEVGSFDDPGVRKHEVQPIVSGSEGTLKCGRDILVVEQISSVVGCV